LERAAPDVDVVVAAGRRVQYSRSSTLVSAVVSGPVTLGAPPAAGSTVTVQVGDGAPAVVAVSAERTVDFHDQGQFLVVITVSSRRKNDSDHEAHHEARRDVTAVWA